MAQPKEVPPTTLRLVAEYCEKYKNKICLNGPVPNCAECKYGHIQGALQARITVLELNRKIDQLKN